MNEESCEQYEPLNYLQYLSFSTSVENATCQSILPNDESTLGFNNEHATEATISNNETFQQNLKPVKEAISEFIIIVNNINSFANSHFKQIIEFLNTNLRDEEFDRQISKELINIIKKTKAEERVPKLCILDAMTKSLPARFVKCFAPRLLEVFTETFIKSKENNTKRALIQIFNGWRDFYERNSILKPISDRVKLPFFEKSLFIEANPSELEEYRQLINSQIETPIISQRISIEQTSISNIQINKIESTNLNQIKKPCDIDQTKKWENINQVPHFDNYYKDSNCVNNSYISNCGLYGFGATYDSQNIQFKNHNIHNYSEISNKNCLISQPTTKFSLRDPLIEHPKNNIIQKDLSYFSDNSQSESQKVEIYQNDQFKSLHHQMSGLVHSLQRTVSARADESNMQELILQNQSKILTRPLETQDLHSNVHYMKPLNSLCKEINKEMSFFQFVSNKYNSMCQTNRNLRDFERFNGEFNKIKTKDLIEALYTNLAYQCRICGMRFQAHHSLNDHYDYDHFMINKLTNFRPLFKSREEFIGRDYYINNVLNKTKKTTGLIDLYELNSDNFVGQFDYSQIVAIEDVKSNYLSCVMCGERFHAMKCYSDDSYYYANAKLLSINNSDPFLVHLDKCYPKIAKAQLENSRKVDNEKSKI